MQSSSATVERIRDLTHDVRELRLRVESPADFTFKAGQFVSFDVLNPKTGRPVTRAYSIASPPSHIPTLTLLFNRVADGPGSTYLFGLKEGDHTQFKGPAGSFYLKDDPGRDLLFIATGTGIAPLRSMIYARLEQSRGDARPVTLYWGLRSQRDLYYQDELTDLATRHPRFSFVTTLSRPEEGWNGETGRVTKLVQDRLGPVDHLSVYLCGNGSMIKEVTALVGGKGLCPIHKEKWYDDPGQTPDY